MAYDNFLMNLYFGSLDAELFDSFQEFQADASTRGIIEKILGGVCDVGCPQIFGEPGKVTPGAVFLMLEKSPTKERSSYGKLQLNRTGDLLLDGSEIKNLTTLVQKCLAGFRHA